MQKEEWSRRLHPAVVEKWLVILIALHSLAVGFFLLGLTEWSLVFGGWGEARPLFFPRQAGVFHLVVALGYLYEYRRYRSVGLLLIAKTSAVVFLLAATALTAQPAWAVPLSALADGAMAVVVAVVHSRGRPHSTVR